MVEQVEIRPYHNNDKKKLIHIFKLNTPTFFAESELEDYENYLDHEVENYFVAEAKGAVIGAGGVNFENSHKTGKLSWDFIHPEFHTKGIGSKLLAYRIAFLKSFQTIETISVRTSQHAYKFYEKNGFMLKEIHKDFWAKGFDRYDMLLE